MSCPTCNCNPCTCNCSCDPANEALSSAFLNFTQEFIGPISKSCVNGEVVWSLPCGMGSSEPVSGFPKLSGESILCYYLRILQALAAGGAVTFPITIAQGGTGQVDAASALAALGGQPLDADLTALAGIAGVNGDVIIRSGGTWVRLPVGSGGQLLTVVGGLPAWATATIINDYALIQDQKVNGTDGGTAVALTWNIRDLNTIVSDSGSVISALAANRFQPVAGTYRYRIEAPAFLVTRHRVRLFNFTDGAVVTDGYGQNAYAGAGVTVQTNAVAVGVFSTDGSKEFRVDHYSEAGNVTTGLGVANSVGDVEKYAQVELWRVS